MSGDEKDPKNLVDEDGKDDSGDEKENDKNVGPSKRDKKERNKSGGEESEVETFDDEMSYEKWKAWKKKKEQKKKKSSSQVIIDSSDDSDTDSKRRASRSSNKGTSSKSKGKGDYRRVAHDYTFSLRSEHNASIHMDKPPFFDGTGYNQ
jgi:hypothetical protein